MSQLRRVEITEFDDDIVRQTVEELGGKLYKQMKIGGFATRNYVADLVIELEGKRFGIVHGETEDKLLYDDMYQKEVLTFVSNYIKNVLKRRGFNPQMVDRNTHISIIV